MLRIWLMHTVMNQLSPILGMVCRFWAFWEGLRADRCQTLPVTSPGIPVRSYKVIHGWWLPLLGLGLHRRGQAVYQGQLHQYWAWGRSAKGLQDPESASTCRLPIRLSRCKSSWWYPGRVKQVLSESPGRGEWCLPGWYRFKLGASVGSESTQQKFQGTARPVSAWDLRTFVVSHSLRGSSRWGQ